MKKIASYILVFFCGVFVMKCYLSLSAYLRMNSVWRQGKDIVEHIDKHKEATGSFPNQAWYSQEFPDPVTREGREWIYLNLQPTAEEETLLIVTRIDYSDSYYAVYSGGLVKRVEISSLLKKN